MSTKQLRTVVIDDEPLAVSLLLRYVERHPSLRLSAGFHNPIDGLAHLDRSEADVLFLDIQMPELNGLHLARLVRGKCAVIFTTAYEDHALEGFELDAVDYLLKPIAYARFERAVAKLAPRPVSDGCFVKCGNRNLRIAYADIRYGSADGDYLSIYLADGSRLMTLENLSDLIARLPKDRFCRIHRSHFVSLSAIDFVERRRVVIGERWFPISDSYRTEFIARLGA